MAESQYPTSSISLGPGGRVTDPALVEELERTPVLQPKELLELAIYFNAFETNATLGNLLWKYGTARIITDRRVAPVIKVAFNLDPGEYWDQQEDSGTGPDENAEDPFDLNLLFIVINGIGLLIEGRILENGETVFYVVNVSPDPRNLPDPEAHQARRTSASTK